MKIFAVILGILFTAKVAFLGMFRKSLGVVIIMIGLVFSIGYFKNDVIQLIRESNQREEQRLIRQEKIEQEIREIRIRKDEADRIEKERLITLELERQKIQAVEIAKAKIKEQQAVEKARQERTRIEQQKFEQDRQDQIRTEQQAKDKKRQENIEIGKKIVSVAQRQHWISESLAFAKKHNFTTVKYEDGTSRTVSSLEAEKRTIDMAVSSNNLESVTNSVTGKYEQKTTMSATESSVERELKDAKCNGYRKIVKEALDCFANPGSYTRVGTESCVSHNHSSLEQIFRSTNSEIQKICN